MTAASREFVQTFTDLYRFRFVLSNLVDKNLKVMYRSMSLGMLWTLLNPLVMVATLTIVWVVVFHQPTSFAAMVIVGLIPYNFTVYCLTGCVHAITSNAPLVKKSSFPRQILPISVVVTHLIHFAIQSTLMIAALLLFKLEGGHFGFHLLWVVPIFLVQVALCVGLGLLVSGLSVMYRDVQYITESLLTVLFWICPLIYSDKDLLRALEPTSVTDAAGRVTEIPPSLADWHYYAFYANPLSGIITAYRDVLFHGHAPGVVPFGQAILMTFVIGYFGVRTFWKHEREFADLI